MTSLDTFVKTSHSRWQDILHNDKITCSEDSKMSEFLKDAFKQNSLLTGFLTEDVSALVRMMTCMTIPEGEKIIEEVECFFGIVLIGEIEQTNNYLGKKISNRKPPGSLVGELGYFESSVKGGEIIFKKSTTLAVLLFDDLNAFASVPVVSRLIRVLGTSAISTVHYVISGSTLKNDETKKEVVTTGGNNRKIKGLLSKAGPTTTTRTQNVTKKLESANADEEDEIAVLRKKNAVVLLKLKSVEGQNAKLIEDIKLKAQEYARVEGELRERAQVKEALAAGQREESNQLILLLESQLASQKNENKELQVRLKEKEADAQTAQLQRKKSYDDGTKAGGGRITLSDMKNMQTTIASHESSVKMLQDTIYNSRALEAQLRSEVKSAVLNAVESKKELENSKAQYLISKKDRQILHHNLKRWENVFKKFVLRQFIRNYRVKQMLVGEYNLISDLIALVISEQQHHTNQASLLEDALQIATTRRKNQSKFAESATPTDTIVGLQVKNAEILKVELETLIELVHHWRHTCDAIANQNMTLADRLVKAEGYTAKAQAMCNELRSASDTRYPR